MFKAPLRWCSLSLERSLAATLPSYVESGQGGCYAEDKTKMSFLISFSMMEKMELIDTKKAIPSDFKYVPTFGRNHDLKIPDACHENQLSQIQFPENYNSRMPLNKSKQEVWNHFCGVSEGCSFRVKEYEVYQVYEVLWNE